MRYSYVISLQKQIKPVYFYTLFYTYTYNSMFNKLL